MADATWGSETVEAAFGAPHVMGAVDAASAGMVAAQTCCSAYAMRVVETAGARSHVDTGTGGEFAGAGVADAPDTAVAACGAGVACETLAADVSVASGCDAASFAGGGTQGAGGCCAGSAAWEAVGGPALYTIGVACEVLAADVNVASGCDAPNFAGGGALDAAGTCAGTAVQVTRGDALGGCSCAAVAAGTALSPPASDGG
mmetsp:Transcript_114868/g.324657  ORF Transcript_114868/g.324657 Transcript_114868/m.324657 type:complete len:202 (-) Transcript_114868:127-732(-)